MKETTRILAALYFVCMAIAVTFPGTDRFNTIRPFVLGLPFALVWVVGWIIGALIVFTLVHLAHRE